MIPERFPTSVEGVEVRGEELEDLRRCPKIGREDLTTALGAALIAT